MVTAGCGQALSTTNAGQQESENGAETDSATGHSNGSGKTDSLGGGKTDSLDESYLPDEIGEREIEALLEFLNQDPVWQLVEQLKDAGLPDIAYKVKVARRFHPDGQFDEAKLKETFNTAKLLDILIVAKKQGYYELSCRHVLIEHNTGTETDGYEINKPETLLAIHNSGCTFIDSDLTVDYEFPENTETHPSLDNAKPLKNVEKIEGVLHVIFDSNHLKKLNGLSKTLQEVHGLHLENQRRHKLTGHYDSGWITIGDSPRFEKLTKIKGDVVIEKNPRLTFLRSLNRVETIEGDLIIRNNGRSLPPGGGSRIDNHDFLGLQSLRVVKGSLVIAHNRPSASRMYRKCDGQNTGNQIYEERWIPPNIERIGQDLVVKQYTFKDAKHEAHSFNNLRYVGGDLDLSFTHLQHFKSFKKLDEVGGQITLPSSANQTKRQSFIARFSPDRTARIEDSPTCEEAFGSN
jgi:hypothetical protein